MKRIFLVLGILFLSIQSAFAQAAPVLPDAAQLQAWQQFNERRGGQWAVYWGQETGTPAACYGRRSVVSYPNVVTPEAAARQFLQEHRAIFRMTEDLSDLALVRHNQDNGTHYLRFQQTCQGYKVYGGLYTVAVANQAAHYAGGRYYPAWPRCIRRKLCPVYPVISMA